MNHKEICKEGNDKKEEEEEKSKKETKGYNKKKWITECNQLLECLLFPKLFYTEYQFYCILTSHGEKCTIIDEFREAKGSPKWNSFLKIALPQRT